jgi:hypothetical protein
MPQEIKLQSEKRQKLLMNYLQKQSKKKKINFQIYLHSTVDYNKNLRNKMT